MLFRFCLYGFLKNQQYFEPFLILALRGRGLSFAMIGVLIGFREICINLMEIPTGAIADVMGRRRAMIASHVAYITAFVIFAMFCGGQIPSQVAWLFGAMFAFSIGEAFRTGTHKAIIFAWLENQGRENEKTKIYGYTRSWSKLGSAVSVLVAAGLVFYLENYEWVFWLCIVPYVINIVNFLTYPAWLDGEGHSHEHLRAILQTLWRTLHNSWQYKPLRRLLAEGMGFDGLFKVTKDYLQPVVKTAALGLPVLLSFDDHKRTALLIGVVYFVLYLLSSFASRHADTLSRASGGDERGSRILWLLNFLAFAILGIGILVEIPALAIIAFVGLAMLQNFWRPMLVSRVAGRAHSEDMATVLSIESQAQTLFAAIAAPLLGLAVDFLVNHQQALAGDGLFRFLPIAMLGLAVSIVILSTGRSRRES